jgi:ferrochelatase
VWTAEGSPLAVTTARQADELGRRLRARGVDVRTAVAMRYGQPSIERAVDALLADGCDRLVAVPMYPQYAGATTGSSLERLFAVIGARRVVPPVRVLPPYFEAPAYIASLAAAVREDLGDWTPDHLVMSFHGLPKRYASEGDPYPLQCQATARALAQALDWPADRWTLAYQSRFGREEWLQPYTDEVLRALAARRPNRVAVVCPGFTADCLETIEEIGITGREKFHAQGGGEYRLLSCLNARDVWLRHLTELVMGELGGWVSPDAVRPGRTEAHGDAVAGTAAEAMAAEVAGGSIW